MTPKEKALELCNKFMIHNSYQSIVWYNAKQCALIAVDEILKAIPNEYLETYKGESNFIINEDIEYWQEVKNEILNFF